MPHIRNNSVIGSVTSPRSAFLRPFCSKTRGRAAALQRTPPVGGMTSVPLPKSLTCTPPTGGVRCKAKRLSRVRGGHIFNERGYTSDDSYITNL